MDSVKIDYVLTTKGVLNIAFNGKAFTVAKHEDRFKRVAELCEKATVEGLLDPEVDEMSRLLNPSQAIKDAFSDAVAPFKLEVIHGLVYKNGEPLHNAVTRKIEEFVKEDLPYGPLFRFLERLEANPSADSRAELYDFLDRTGLPITPDGCFLAYKGVTQDLKDCHTGKFDNSPGQVHELRRDEVDPDRRRECSYGFHVGAFPYARGFGAVVVRVKVDPADAVAVPLDHNAQKLRTRKYEVLDIYDTSKGEMPKPLYGEKGEDFVKPQDSQDSTHRDANAAANLLLTFEKVRDVIVKAIYEVTGERVTDFDRRIESYLDDEDDDEFECKLNELDEKVSAAIGVGVALDVYSSVAEAAEVLYLDLGGDEEGYASAEHEDDYSDEEDEYEQETDEPKAGFATATEKPEEEDEKPEEDPVLDDGPFTSVKKRTSWYMDLYTRDEIAAYAAKRGVVKHKEEARRIGKEATAQRLAEQDFAAKD